MRFYLHDKLLPQLDPEILNQLGVDREEFIHNVIYGELTRDPSAYDESVIVSMDDFLVQHLSYQDYDYFLANMAMRLAYEDDYIKAQGVVARYLRPILKHHDYGFDLRILSGHGYVVDLNHC